MTDRHPSLARCGLVWLTASLGLAALAAWVLPDLAAARGALAAGELARQPFERLLLWVFAGAALLGAGWLWVVTTMVTLEAARGTEAGTPGVPPVVRRAVLAACGVALSGAVVAPAGATPGHLHLDEAGSPAVAVLSGLPLPDRAGDATPAAGPLARRLSHTPSPTHATHATPVIERVEVRPGDTLWGIAAGQLGPGASAEAIAQQWRRIYAANRDVLGPDPDLVHPGQQLRLPRS